MLRTANPKDFKNVTFDALSFFFFFIMQLDERVLSSCDVVGLVKNTLSLCVLRSIQHENLTLTLSLQTSYVQSNGDLFSAKIEQSSVLVDDAYRQIRNAPCDDRQVNDLRRPLRYLISWRHAR